MPEPTQAGDVVLTSEAPLGRVARVESDSPLVLGQRLFALRGRKDVLHSRFLFYALQTERVQADLVGRATGTTVIGIRQSALRNVGIPAPGLREQLGIAEVLGALDDKIAANSRAAVIAGSLLEATFKRASGDARHGPTFGELADIGGGGTPRTSMEEYWNGDVPWATPTDITALSMPYLTRTSRSISEEGLANCASRLYPAGSILMTSRATIGAFAIAQVPVAVNQGFIVVNANDADLQMWLLHDMQSRVDEFISNANGATFLELSRGRFKALRVRVAEPDAMKRFAGFASKIHRHVALLASESTRLAITRDALLPLLMSGKVTIKDAESVAGEVF